MKDKLRELAERWREESSNAFGFHAARKCASELLAILDAERIEVDESAMQEKCFCDRMYPESNADASCGDCPKRDYKAQPSQAVDVGAIREGNVEIVRRMTAAMREADESFLRVGGSTRHHVRDCLLPILGKHGLCLCTIAAPSVPEDREVINK